jgi:hypothetical protein
MKRLSVLLVSTLCVALIVCGANSLTAFAAGEKTSLEVAQAAYNALRAAHGKLAIGDALTTAAEKADFNVAIFPNGFVVAYQVTVPNAHDVAMLVNDGFHGEFSCVHFDPANAKPPTTALCPVTYFAAFISNVRASAKFLFATQIASTIGLGAQEAARATNATKALSGSAVSSAVPKTLKLVSGVLATRDGSRWTINVRDVSVCLSFASNGEYLVRGGACS